MSSPAQKKKLSICGLSMWLIVAVFYGLDYLQHTMPSVLILPISKSIAVDYVTVTDIINIYFPIYALSQIPAGYIIDRLGLRLALFGASIILSIGLLCMAMPGISYILIGRALIAIGSAFAWNGGLKAAELFLPKSFFPFMTGLLNSIGVISGIGGMIFINHLLHITGWQHAIHLVGVFGAIWAFVILFLLRGRCNKGNEKILDTPRIKIPARLLWSLLKDGQLWLVTLYAALITGVIMYTFAESYSIISLEKLKHITSTQAAWLNSLIFIGVGVGGPIHGIIANLFHKKTTWISITAFATLISFTLLCACFYYSLSIDLLAIAYFCIGFFVVAMLLSYSITKERFPTGVHAILFAFINMIVMLAGFIIPMIFGHLIHVGTSALHWKHPLMLPITALLVPLLAACIMTLWIKTDRVIGLEKYHVE